MGWDLDQKKSLLFKLNISNMTIPLPLLVPSLHHFLQPMSVFDGWCPLFHPFFFFETKRGFPNNLFYFLWERLEKLENR